MGSVSAQAQCTINMSGADLQTMDGFGAFSAWSGPIPSEQGPVLFGTGNGQLGMSLFRVYIDENRNWGEATSNTKLAHSYGVKVLGSSWTPPIPMKNNQSLIGGSLLRSAYSAFATHLADAAQAINFDYVSPQNEPDYLPDTYGGCGWSGADLETWCQNNAPTVGKPIVVGESFNGDTALCDSTLNNSQAANNVSVVGVHLYGATPVVHQNALNRGKRVWMTEHCLENNDFNAAIETAREISDCMNCNYSAYIWWWINAQRPTSLIDGNKIDTRGAMFGQFSRFIRPGSVRVGATYSPQSGVFITAYRVNGGCTIVVLNQNTSPVNQQFNIQNSSVDKLKGFQTSVNQSMVDIGMFNVTGGSFSTTLPEQSLTTFVQSTVPSIAYQPQNSSALLGADAKFSVTAAGLDLKYQWYFNETTALAGANGPVLTLTGEQASRVGAYSVVVSNSTGSVTSSAAYLTICPLVWSKPVTISSTTDISTSGTLLYAYNCSGSNGTVNGVSFTGVDSAITWGTGVTLSGYDARLTSGFADGSTAPLGSLDAGYRKILRGGAFKWASGEASVTLNSLVAGHQYQVQMWVNDSRSGSSAFRTQTAKGANAMSVAFNNTQAEGGLGQYVIGSFTATGNSQTFMLSGGGTTPQINAIQVRDVSESGAIVWGVPTTVSDEMDISTTGSLLYAYNNSGSSAAVNGVDFQGVNSANAWGADVTLSGFNASLTSAFAGESTAPWSNLGAQYRQILQGGAFNWASGAATVTLNNLTPGRKYGVQVWVNDSRSGGAATRTETFAGNNFVTAAFNTTQAQDGVGQHTLGSFTATAANQSFTINGGTNPPQINAIQLRDITEAFATSLPVTNGLVLRMDASQVTCTDGGQVDAWADTSGSANHAIRLGGSSNGYPKYVATGTNGLPVIRFNSGSAVGDGFRIPRISNIRTVFWVMKENAGVEAGRFLLGDESVYQFHRGNPNGALWSSVYADAKVKNGTTKLMGNVIDGTLEPMPSERFQLVSLTTTGDVQANQICQDRTANGSWQGDIAEILIYNRALTSVEEGEIGSYLATKYALPTVYAGSKVPAVPSGVSAALTSPTAVTVSWFAVSSAVSYNIWCKPSAGGVERVFTGVATSPYSVTGLVPGISYDFKVAAINTIGTSAYSSVSTTISPNDNSASTGVTAWGADRVDTFAIGADKNLYWKFWDGSAWSQYNSLNATASAGVAATHWGPNRLDVFYTGNSGSMKHKWYTGGWAAAEQDLGGVLVGAPAATAWGPNRIDVFCRGTDNKLYWNYFNGEWSSWLSGDIGAYTYSSPVVVNWGVDRLHVFYTGIDGSVRHKWYNGNWSYEENLGGKIIGGPSAVAWNNSRIDLLVRGLDNQLYWKFWNGSSWSGFNALGVFAFSDPAVTSRGSDAFDIFYRGSNGVMKQKSYYLGNWSPEYDFGLPAGNQMAARPSKLSAASRSASVASRSAVVSSKSSALPLPWAPGNIGSSQLSGTSSYNAGTIVQSGSGALGSTSDKLNFSYQTLSGDGEIIAKISILQDTGTLSGVGVMIRETLATNSKHVFMGISGSNTYTTANRVTTSGITTTGTAGTGTVPNTWVKLVRVGNVITASKSPDGKIWKTVGSTTVTMAENSYIGLAVSSGSDGVLNNSQFTNLSVTP
jgi:glucuronoarabinoxylan endo-1,4-beta-xylanase